MNYLCILWREYRDVWEEKKNSFVYVYRKNMCDFVLLEWWRRYCLRAGRDLCKRSFCNMQSIYHDTNLIKRATGIHFMLLIYVWITTLFTISFHENPLYSCLFCTYKTFVVRQSHLFKFSTFFFFFLYFLNIKDFFLFFLILKMKETWNWKNVREHFLFDEKLFLRAENLSEHFLFNEKLI